MDEDSVFGIRLGLFEAFCEMWFQALNLFLFLLSLDHRKSKTNLRCKCTDLLNKYSHKKAQRQRKCYGVEYKLEIHIELLKVRYPR